MPRFFERGNQMVEPLEGDRIELLGVVTRVVEQAAIGPVRGVEIAQPHQVDARAGQAIGKLRRRPRPRGNAAGGKRQTPKNRARSLPSNVRCPSLTVTDPRARPAPAAETRRRARSWP